MIWREITIWTADEAVESIANFFHEHGAGGVVIEESGSLNRPRDTSLGQWYELPLNDIPEGEAIVQAYYADLSQADRVAAALQTFVDQIRTYPLAVGPAAISVKDVQEEDWESGWKQYFKPVAITERMTVKPTWEPYIPRPDEIVLELDPGMAFGTGTHATTALCLTMLEKYVQAGQRVIDVGTGSGILSVAAAKLGASRVLALDLDPVAVSSATENVRLNGLSDRIAVVESDLLQVLKNDANPSGVLPANLIVANILAEIILLFIDDVREALEPGGIYLVSGVIAKKERDVRAALEAAGFHIAESRTEDEWVALAAIKS